MKQNSLGTKLLMVVACLAVLTYFGAQGIRKSGFGRIAACKGDHPRPGYELEDLADGAAGNIVKPAGVADLVKLHGAHLLS